MLFNYAVGLSVSKNAKERYVKKMHLLVFGIISNVVLLGYFKYSDFFIENSNFLLNTDPWEDPKIGL